jgi:thiamine-phosphate pyrophosphorylase
MPIVAIGGITPDNVRVALEAGASGVAVINGIFGAKDMEAATRRLRRALDDSG